MIRSNALRIESYFYRLGMAVSKNCKFEFVRTGCKVQVYAPAELSGPAGSIIEIGRKKRELEIEMCFLWQELHQQKEPGLASHIDTQTETHTEKDTKALKHKGAETHRHTDTH